MEEMIEYILRFGNFNQQQINFIKSKCTIHKVQKNDYVMEAGFFVNHIYFLKEGIVRISFFTKSGDEVTKYFIDENHFAFEAGSFMYRTQATSYVQAITDCEFVTISRTNFEEISSTILHWDEVFHKMVTKGLTEKVDRISPMLAETASERYERFLEKFPGMVNRIPLAMLASYLGITQSSLSRIRREVK